MKIGVVGGGVSGLGAALALSEEHDVTLFEKDARLGGHAHTVSIDYDGERIDVDTGFIVYNDVNYPNFVALTEHLGVATHASDMSFSVSGAGSAEWSSNGLGGLFAWKRNMASPAFLCMLGDIVRFSAQARTDLAAGRIGPCSLGDYVDGLKLGHGFRRNYLLPMGAAIWSTPEDEMLRYPAESFLRFFQNHRLMHVRRISWRTVIGGSQSYVSAIAARLGSRVRAGDPVVAVQPQGNGALVRTQTGSEQRFDRVVLACHSDQARALIGAETQAYRLLGAIRYAPNTAYLHRDASLMPRRQAAWASWNYMREQGDGGVCVSYWMNKLQNLPERTPLFVTLNPATPPAEHLRFGRYSYDHPQFDRAALEARAEIERLQGEGGIYFAGAWTGNGFHEDGLRSGLDVAARLGAHPSWSRLAARYEAPSREAVAA